MTDGLKKAPNGQVIVPWYIKNIAVNLGHSVAKEIDEFGFHKADAPRVKEMAEC